MGQTAAIFTDIYNSDPDVDCEVYTYNTAFAVITTSWTIFGGALDIPSKLGLIYKFTMSYILHGNQNAVVDEWSNGF